MGMSLGGLKCLALDVVGAVGIAGGNRHLLHLQEKSFLRLRFAGVNGRVLEGSAMQVLYKGVPSEMPSDENDPSSAFWYCLGPDEQLYVAMPISYRIGWGWRVDWEVQAFCKQRHGRPRLLQSVPAGRLALETMHTMA